MVGSDDFVPDWERYVRMAMARSGLFLPETAGWIVTPIRDSAHLGHYAATRAVATLGGEFSEADKRARGIRKRAEVGAQLWAYLTDEGRKAPWDAASDVVLWALKSYYLDRNLTRYRDVNLALIEFRTDRDRCCDAAAATYGREFAPAKAPWLPLDGCDKRLCPCDYLPVVGL